MAPEVPLWVGPAVVAAVISAIITAFGWYASHLSNRRLDMARREERVRDIQTALRAEMRSYRDRLPALDIEAYAAALIAKMSEAAASGTLFTPFVPREDHTFVFSAITGEIHILPTEVVDPIVLYYKQMISISHLVDDLRSEAYARLEAERQIEIYKDYVAMNRRAADLAEQAIVAIDASLRHGAAQ